VEKFNVLAFVGAPRAGKSFLGRETLRQNSLGKRLVYFLNDEGIDGEIVDQWLFQDIAAQGLGELKTMPSGCFFCVNEDQLGEKVLEYKMSGAFGGAVLEGYGFLSGHDTKAVLTKAGLSDAIIVAVIAAQDLEANLKIWGEDLLASHLHVADAVGITQFPAEIDPNNPEDALLTSCREFIATHAPGKPWFLIPPGGALPPWILELIRPDGIFNDDLGDIEHHERHTHPAISYTFRCIDGLDINACEDMFAGAMNQGIVRTKAVINGWHYESAFGKKWERTVEARDSNNMITFYAKQPIWLEYIPGLSEIIVRSEERKVDTTNILRNAADIVQTQEAIKTLLSRTPCKVIVTGDRKIITHPEALQAANNVIRRPGVTRELFVSVRIRCIEYWIAVVSYIQQHELELDSEGIAASKREMVSLPWYILEMHDDLEPELVKQAVALDPAQMIAEGFRELRIPYRDPEKGFWQAQEVYTAWRFQYEICRLSTSAIVGAMRHVRDIYRAHHIEGKGAEQWEQILKQVENA